jgi:alanyl-tRNA synthetase
MPTSRLYLQDSSLLETTASIREITLVADGYRILLDRTIFHPQGGGQKADRGTIADAVVTHVAFADGEVEHLVSSIGALSVGQSVQLSVDSAWRELNARSHTAGHLIAAILESRFPTLKAVSGHHWPGEARVEFVGEPRPSDSDALAILHDEIMRAVADRLPVKVEGDPFSSRAIRIGAFAPIPCGGTHLSSLADLQAVRVTQVKVKSGKLRVSYQIEPASIERHA